MENWSEICHQVVDLCRNVGDFLMFEKNKITAADIQTKGQHDYVTYVDKMSERKLVDGLSKIFPQAGFIAEEGTNERLDPLYNWIIDPLDGTTNFIHGLAPFAISIGLKCNDEIIMGVIYEPNLDEAFYAWEGSDAYLNNEKIKVSKTTILDNALIATGFPYSDYSRLAPYMQIFDWCLRNTRGVRRLGSAAADLAYVACGRMDGFYEYGLKPWDVAAGSFILQRAGGRVSDFSGGNNFLFGQELLAFNRPLHSAFLKVMKENFI
jgi:myo-inositol-1(or 4)-monophosphatase